MRWPWNRKNKAKKPNEANSDGPIPRSLLPTDPLPTPPPAFTANGLRIIHTARDLDAINRAVREGFKPLILPVVPDPRIRSKVALFKNIHTGLYETSSDLRHYFWSGELKDQVTKFLWYYPYKFAEPFAAYLLPPDLYFEERVLLEDLIEDYIGGSWNQGDVWRLASCEATWNGRSFTVHYDPKELRRTIVG